MEKMNSWVIFLGVPSGYVKIAIEAMAIEIVDLPIENGGSFHSELLVYQRVFIV